MLNVSDNISVLLMHICDHTNRIFKSPTLSIADSSYTGWATAGATSFYVHILYFRQHCSSSPPPPPYLLVLLLWVGLDFLTEFLLLLS